MRRFLMLALLVDFGVMTWRLGTSLSSDALGMAVGVVFGGAGRRPGAAAVLATNSRRANRKMTIATNGMNRYQQRGDRQLPAYPYQPPVIVVAGAQSPQAAPPPFGPGAVLRPTRRIRGRAEWTASLRWWGSTRSGLSERWGGGSVRRLAPPGAEWCQVIWGEPRIDYFGHR